MRLTIPLAAVIILAACGGGDRAGGGDPLGTETNGSIRGTVTDNTGATVANAAVALSGNAQAARTANSGADGVYTFADVPAGTYTLAVTPPTGFTVGTAGTASVTVARGAQASASAIVLNRVPVSTVDTCGIARPDFGGPATAADRALFAYNASAPLNLQRKVDSTAMGVQFNSISYDSPDGGSVTGIMYVPLGRSGPRTGVVVMHGSFGLTAPAKGARLTQFEMMGYASRGAVAIGIDAPYVRRGTIDHPPTMSVLDRSEQIQLIKDLQRAVDVLLAQGNVDPARIGFSGYSYGGMVGVHFAGIERRLKAAVIAAGYGGSVTAATNANFTAVLSTYSCDRRNAWFREMVPIEPIRFIPGASPTALLFQIARFDTNVFPADAQAAYDAASSPKEVLYYDSGHGFPIQALQDRYSWMTKQLGMEPPEQ